MIGKPIEILAQTTPVFMSREVTRCGRVFNKKGASCMNNA
jgi:hypothetical protein